MKIKLVTGATAFEAAKNTIAQINPMDLETENLVVVPDSFSMQAESLIFDVLNIKATFNIEVVGISRLASKILRNQNIGYRRISGLEESFNIFKAVKLCQDKFVYFGKCGMDFCLKILQMVKQFKSCKISPGQIRDVGDDLLDRKMRDLKLIYQTYNSLLEDKLDLSGLLEFFVENAQKNLDLSKIKLFFVNFDSFSMEINSFICKIAGFVKEIYIGFARPISVGNAFIYEDDILRKTTQYAKEYGISVEVENFPTKINGNSLAIVKNLFSFDIQPCPSDFFVNIVAKNRNEEMEYVAKYIKNAVTNGWKFKDFGIAVPDKSYFDDLKTTLGEFEIVSYSDDAVDLSQTILGRFLLKILEIAKLNFQKESAQFLASCPLFDVQNREDVLTQIDYFNVSDEKEFLTRFSQFENVIKNIENLKKCITLNDFLNILLGFLQIIENSYAKLLQDLQESGYFKKESENAQARELILSVIEKLKELGGEEKFELGDFENLFNLALKSVKVETVPSYVDAVYVGDATDSYFEDVKVLFVLGATANKLPKTQNDIGIIDDDDIKKLRLDFALEPEIKVLNRRSRLKLFELLQHAKRKLIVSTPLSDGGQMTQKSGFVNDLLSIFGENVIHTSSLEDFDVGILTEEDALNRFLFLVGNKQNLSNVATKLESEDKLPKKWVGTINHVMDKKIQTDQEKLDGLTAKSPAFDKQTFSASELETYFHCPYKRFVTYGLKIKPKENIEPNRRLFGIFEHDLLRTFLTTFHMDISKVTGEDLEKFLKENVKKLAEKVYDEKILNRRYFLKFLHDESKIILKNAIYEQKQSSFRPIMLEEKVFQKIFKNENLKGFVDRVDKAENYFRIIDYKTGRTEGIKKDLYYGRKLQLFLYAKCIGKKLGLDCGGVYYFNCQTKYSKRNQNITLFNGMTLKDNHVVGMTDGRLWQEGVRSDLVGMSRKKNIKNGEFEFKNGNAVDEFEIYLDYATEVSQGAVDEIRSGYFQAKPIKDECDSCPFHAICRHRDSDGYRVLQSVKDDNFKGRKHEN